MLISSFMAVSARSVHASDNLETLLGLLETRAQSVYTANWTFDTVAMKGVPVYKLPFANDMLRSAHEKGIGNHKIDPLSRVNGDALFDFRKELYKLQFEWRRLQPGSESAIIVEKRVMSFNGEMFVDLVEPNQSNNQSLARVEFDRVYRDVGLRRARLLDSGYFYSPHQLPFIRGISKVDNLTWTLDDFLKECRSNSKVKFSVRSAEHWVVSFPLTWESKDYGIAEYAFNPRKGGALESVARLPSAKHASSEDYTFKNIEWTTGVYGPSEVLWIDWVTGFGRLTKITNVRLNDSELVNEKSFVVQVPTGAMVNDQEHQMFYTASKGPKDEANSIRKYIEVNDVALSHLKQSNSYLYVVMGISTMIVFVCVLVWWRRGMTLCLAMLLLGQFGCYSKQIGRTEAPLPQFSPASSDFVWDEGWKWAFSGQESIGVSQCGFTASILILGLFDRSFDPLLASRLMPPTTLGTKLSDIKSVLEAHSIDTQARSGVEIEDLFRYLDGESVAIVHRPMLDTNVSKQAHYVVVIRKDLESLLYLDPPHAPFRMTKENKAEWIGLKGLTVLICRRNLLDRNLQVENPKIRFYASDFVEGKYSGKFELHNRSPKPMYLRSVTLPCSCVSTDFQPQILRESSSLTISFTIHGLQWGYGYQEKSLKINGHADLAIAQVDLIGESVTAKLPNLGNRHAAKLIEIPLNCEKKFVVSSIFPLFDAGAIAADNLSTLVSEEWCQCEIVMQDSEVCLRVDCSIDSSRMQDFLSSGRSSTSVAIFSKGESIPFYELSLTLRRDLEMKSSRIRSEEGEAVIEISVHPASDAEWLGWNLTEVEVDSNELSVESVRRVDNKTWCIDCKRVGMADRPFTGKCVFEREGFPAIRKPISIGFASFPQ